MRLYIIGMLLSLGLTAQAQSDTLQLTFEGSDIRVRINRSIQEGALDSLLCSYGTCMAEMDSLWESTSKTTSFGWVLEEFDGPWIEMRKALDALEGEAGKNDILLVEDSPKRALPYTTFGYNDLKEPVIFETADNNTIFNYSDDLSADQVFIAGSFNDWDPTATPMERTTQGWKVSLHLEPGKHLYKYVVDGDWTNDPENNRSEFDGYWGKNSVYFKTNYTFTLNGNEDARKVTVAGSFNGWNEKSIRLRETDGKWELPVYVKEGTYTYKFVVNGKWILDPLNARVRDDGMGNLNSVFSLGPPHMFQLEGFLEANEVILTGSFNMWNEGELKMVKLADGWYLDHVLAPGNYEYKFIVDGVWTLDPSNQVTVGEQNYKNSVLSIEPNTRFYFEADPGVQDVRLSGSFNGWNEPGYSMQRDGAAWYLDLFLPKGKYRYKFIVDGKWIQDPENQLFEENEYGEYNSVVWID